MSEFNVEVVRVGKIEKHPNADTLSITRVMGDYPVIIRTGEFQEGDLAVYVPIDSVVPDTEQWAFLKGHRRIKAKRLRGIFSMGMLAAVPCQFVNVDGVICAQYDWHVGQNVQAEMGIEKYEPVVHSGRLSYAENEPDQPFMPKYTDIEGLRRYGKVLVEGEEVVLTEKLHGSNGRWLYRDGRFWVGSHNYLKKEDPGDTWWRALECLGRDKLIAAEGKLFFGEVLGVQDLKYGYDGGDLGVRVFDVFDTVGMRYLDYHEMRRLCDGLGVETVPVIRVCPWSEDLRVHAEGPSVIADHIREGFVVRPTKERWNDSVGRVILKFIGEGYLLRKGA